MYFPDDFAGLAALSERVDRFALRWLRRPEKHSLRPRRNGGVSALRERASASTAECRG
jgi:hypothetical protein